ncbi:hypothetical protein HC891_26830 [Candidatus Gracilibacteria bacterium]|nr:hypothetical protein [Candidatus Gracilibacteria bacterium]
MIEFTGDVFQGIGEALRLNPRVFEIVARANNSNLVILMIAILGGASLLIGQSVILFVNRVSPTRFMISLLVNGILFAINLVIWAIAIWLVGQVLFPNDIPLGTVMRMVGVGAAPYLFGFLVLIPYMGNFIGRMLSVWSFLIVLAGITVIAGGAFTPALVCVGLGWLLIVLMTATIGRPVVALRNRLFRAVAGTDLDASVADILADFATQDAKPGTKTEGARGDPLDSEPDLHRRDRAALSLGGCRTARESWLVGGLVWR